MFKVIDEDWSDKRDDDRYNIQQMRLLWGTWVY